MNESTNRKATRRDFLKTSAAVTGAGIIGQFTNVHAAGDDVIRVGLIGCGRGGSGISGGGRGRGAAMQCINAGRNVVLYAMADMFSEYLQYTRKYIADRHPDKVDVTDDRCFVGFDAYKKLLAIKEIDVVILATPPGFRPQHIRAAVDAGKHIFAEKPIAVDAPGVRTVMKACEDAKSKKLSIVSGLCWRYHHGMRATFDRILSGGVGDIVTLQCTYNTGGLWHVPRQEGWSDMEWQLRNWLYFTWLSGDHNVEQHIHSLDKMLWAMKDEPPVKAVGMGGRQVRTDPVFGHIFDHHSVVYEYANGVRVFSNCRQQVGCKNDISDFVFGTKGVCDVMRHRIRGEKPWHYQRPKKSTDRGMYQNEHDELIASIRAGKPINNGDYMCKSTLMAIMGRMATYTGQEITWEMAMNSKEDLMPQKLEFGPLPVPPVAKPGITKYF
ncbi:MAG: dehydrogenase [Gemmatales bacterium]|nr:MAG: dehydrogenase [Gemmatales bacterium]